MIRSSESLTKFAPAFVEMQHDLPKIARSAEGGQMGGKTIMYATLDALVDAVKDKLHGHGFAVFQGCGEADKGVMVTTRIIHTSGEWIEDGLVMPVGTQSAQAVGSAVSYARRYGLMAALGIATEDDDAASASTQPRATRQTTRASAPRLQAHERTSTGEQVASSQQIAKLQIECRNAGMVTEPQVIQHCTATIDRLINSTKDLTPAEASRCIDAAIAKGKAS